MSTVAPGPRALAAPGGGARDAGAVRPGPGRPRPGRPARRHPLAVAELVRLLPRQRLRSGDPRRPRVVRPRRAGDALVDQPGLHRGRDARPRLAGAAHGAAGPLPVERARRRRHPGHGVERQPVRHPRRPGTGRRPGRPGPAAGLRLDPGPLVGREGRPHRRDGRRPAAAGRRRRRVRHAARRPGRSDPAPTSTPASCRSSSSPPSGTTSSLAFDPIEEIAAVCAPARPVAPRRRRHGRLRRAGAGAAVGWPPAPSTPTRGASTRTSGCSPTSTATCCGWPTVDR